MGVAAYARGSAAISRQITAEQEAKRLVLVDRNYLGALESQVEQLKSETKRLEAELTRAKSAYRLRCAEVRYERTERALCEGRLRKRWKDSSKAMLSYRRRWAYASRLFRRVAPFVHPVVLAEVLEEAS